jgi:NAD(P)-dependent dehydrogenase (short-subunit alcohol dehydrogenase family)
MMACAHRDHVPACAVGVQLLPTGIRINAVCPGIIGNTPMAARVTTNNDPDIIKAFVAAGWATPQKSLLPYCADVVRMRAS